MAHVTTLTKALLAVLLAAMLLCSCNGGKQYPYSLVVADSLLDDRPDSALHVLHGYADSVGQASERDRMYYHLLLTTAEDKCYVPHTSDSVMRMVVEYYEDNGPADKLADAYRIMGRVYDDMFNAPTALEYYKKAIDNMPKDWDMHKVSLTYDHIGTLYIEQNLLKESVYAYLKSYEFAQKSHDTKSLPYVFRNLGRAYTILDNVDSALYYYNKAFDIGNDDFKRSGVLDELFSVYIQIEDTVNAHRILQYDKEAYDSWANYYEAIEDKENAKKFYEKALGTNNIYKKEYVYRKLAEYEEENHSYASALNYLRLAVLYKDSIAASDKGIEVKRIGSMYNYEKIESERKQLSLDKVRQSYVIAMLIAFILLLIVGIVGIYDRSRKKLKYAQDQYERTKILKRTYDADRQIDLETSPLCLSIIRNSTDEDFKLSEDLWKTLFEEIDLRFSNFTLRLRALYPSITDMEIVVCCLVRLDIPNSRIARMLCKSSPAISNIRKRLYEKIHGKAGSAQKLDDFIRNF